MSHAALRTILPVAGWNTEHEALPQTLVTYRPSLITLLGN